MADPDFASVSFETAYDGDASPGAAPDGAAELLLRARALLERGWCQGVAAQNERGAEADPWSPGACRWSADGALAFAHRELGAGGESAESLRSSFQRAELALAAVLGDELGSWNDADGRTQSEVLAAFDQALIRARRLTLRRYAPPPPAASGDAHPSTPIGAFEERRRELEAFLAESDRSPADDADPSRGKDMLLELVGRLEDEIDALPVRGTAQLLARIVREASRQRLRAFTTLAVRLSEHERETIALVLRLPAEKRHALATLLELPSEERAELAAALGLSEPECRAFAAWVHDGGHERAPQRP